MPLPIRSPFRHRISRFSLLCHFLLPYLVNCSYKNNHFMCIPSCGISTDYYSFNQETKPEILNGRLFLRLISQLWLFCCERKTLFHG
jgi:hypothetical protein